MNEEEQQAIEKVNKSYDNNTGWVECEAKTWNIIKNLIDKLQKENKDLEKTIEQLEDTIVELSTAMEE